MKKLIVIQEGKRVTTLGFQFFQKYENEGYKGVSKWYKQVKVPSCSMIVDSTAEQESLLLLITTNRWK